MYTEKHEHITVTVRLRPEEVTALDRVGRELGFEAPADTLRYLLRQIFKEIVDGGAA